MNRNEDKPFKASETGDTPHSSMKPRFESLDVALITFLMGWQATSGLPRWTTPLAQLGRASLTHYILHICLVYVPLRNFFPEESWSIRVGMAAFVVYIIFALPITRLWFRVFARGPLEEVWARVSGRSK